MGGIVSKVTLTLRNITHTFPDDLDVLLVSPGGQKALLLSDAGGGGDINNVTLTLDDAAATALSNGGQLASGTFRPSNYDTSTDTIPSPAPAGPYGTTLSTFNGQSPNGVWSLFVRDDKGPNPGSFAGGWSLTITTVATGPQPPTISDIPNQSTAVNTPTPAIPFTVADPDTPLINLTFSGTSSNPALVTNANIVFGGSGTNRTVTVFPTAGATGTATIAVTVSDGALTATDSFVLTVGATGSGPVTAGETTVLLVDDSSNANTLLAQEAVLSQTATIKSISFYVTAAAGQMLLGVYAPNGPSGQPGTKLAETPEFTPVTGWNTVNVVSEISLSAGTYWLAFYPNNNSLAFRRNDGLPRSYYYSRTYDGTLPGTFALSPTGFSGHWSLYATLQP